MALVDMLAEHLSEKTGSTFKVLRGRVPAPLPLPGKTRRDGQGRTIMVMRYGLQITRGEHSHRFQAHRPMTLGELTRWLASITDMVDMGFIPVQAREPR